MASKIESALPSRRLATGLGGGAILLWALLALFTTGAAGIPTFQLMAMTFGLAFAVSLAVIAARGRRALLRLRQPFWVWLFGASALFGYHFFYFIALVRAPALDASLIAYLWPLLIVVFSALLPGERLRWFHLAGALGGFGGVALLVTGKGALAIDPAYLPGYLAALACALTWSGYSVANRRMGAVPCEAVGGNCGLVALAALACHLGLEESVLPNAGQGLAILGLGIGPVGAAFFLWDQGTKHGDIQLLGALAYGAPLLSALLLIAFGRGEASWNVAFACLLIVGGALLASAGHLLRRR